MNRRTSYTTSGLKLQQEDQAYYYGAPEPEVHFLGIHSPTLHLLWFLGKVQTYVCLTSATIPWGEPDN